jgi:hypothetical protein
MMENRCLRQRTVVWVLAVMTACVPGLAVGQEAPPHEYGVKAAFIYNFIMFVDGLQFQQAKPIDPNGQAAQSKEPEADKDRAIVIGIIGKDPFGAVMGPVLERTVDGRKLTAKYFKGLSDPNLHEKKVTVHPQIEDIKKCDVVFVAASEQAYVEAILGPIKTERILTVGEIPGFLEKGGIMNFVAENNKVRFEANIIAAKRAKLTLRSKLLRLAKRVIDEDEPRRSTDSK